MKMSCLTLCFVVVGSFTLTLEEDFHKRIFTRGFSQEDFHKGGYWWEDFDKRILTRGF